MTIVRVPEAGSAHDRIAWIDLARGLGIVLVVLGHVFTGPISDFLYHFHMPLFFVLSGTVFRPVALWDWTLKRGLSLLIPYFAWMALLVTTSIVTDRLQLTSHEVPRLYSLLFGGVALTRWFTTFWFVTCLFGALAVYNFLRLRAHAFSWQLGLAMLAFFSGGLIIAPHRLPWALNIVPVTVPLLWLGEIYAGFRVPRWVIAPVGLFAVLTLIYTAPVYMKHGQLGTPIISMLGAVAVSYCFLETCRAISFSWSIPRSVHFLAAGSLAIMFVHPAFVYSLNEVLPRIVVCLIAVFGSAAVYLIIRQLGRYPRIVLLGERMLASRVTRVR